MTTKQDYQKTKKSRFKEYCGSKAKNARQFMHRAVLIAGLALGSACGLDVAYYWPGQVLEKNGAVADVTLGFDEDYKQKKEYETEYFKTAQSIPEDFRSRHRKLIQDGIGHAKKYFISDIFENLVENNVFSVDDALNINADKKASGMFLSNPDGLIVFDQNGELGPSRLRSPYDRILVNSESKTSTMFHEILHDAWYSILENRVQNEFSEKSVFLFSVAGDSLAADSLFSCLEIGQYYDFNAKKLQRIPIKGCSIMDWGLEHRVLYDEFDAVSRYLRMRAKASHYNETYQEWGKSLSRNEVMAIESFAFLPSEPGVGVPAFMASAYNAVMEKNMLGAVTLKGKYFSDEESFRNLIPHIMDYVDFAKARCPELNKIDDVLVK